MRILFAAGLACAASTLVQCTSRLYNHSSDDKKPSGSSPEKPKEDNQTPKNQDGTNTAQTPTPPQCPKNYVWVPGNPTPGLGSVANKDGVPSFCIAKFEMKHPADASGTSSDRDNGAVPVSQPQSKPWALITQDEAKWACKRIQIPGFTVALISNSEWQAVARDIESTAANWSGGKVGEGAIPLGHEGRYSTPFASLQVTDEADPYDGTGYNASSGWEQKRTYQLSTGELVWDLGGNVAEWVSDSSGKSLGLEAEDIRERDFGKYWKGQILFGPAGNFGEGQNMYSIYETGSNISGLVLRGGAGNTHGLFDAYLTSNLIPSEVAHFDDWGFRCVARPLR